MYLVALMVSLLFVTHSARAQNRSIGGDKYKYSQIIDPKTGEAVPMVMLDEVVVVPHASRKHYTRRGNPAVELLLNVVAHKNMNRLDTNGYKVKSYEKLLMNIEPFDFDLQRTSFRRDFKFLEKYVDTLRLPYQKIPYLPISMRESLSLGTGVSDKNAVVYGKSWAGMDKMFEFGTLDANIKSMFVPFDIRDNNIELMTVQFISPLSSTQANAFYHYFILDTLQVEGRECIDLAFTPVNSYMLSFEGHLYVVNDSTYALQRCVMHVSSEVNLNWISNLRIVQDFCQPDGGKWAVSSTVMETNFSLSRFMRHSIYARHHTVYDFLPPDAIVESEPLDSAARRSKEWWRRNRLIPLTRSEVIYDTLFSELRAIPRFQRMTKTLRAFAEGYLPTSPDFTFENSYWDFGPVLNTVSYNGVEGWRLRVGGMTTAHAHPHWFAEGYVAYGFRDRRPKGSATLTYSFNAKERYVNESLLNAVSLTGSYDVEIPGSRYSKITRDNILFSIDPHSWFDSTRWNTKAMYVVRGRLKYEKEWANNLYLNTALEYERIEAAGSLNFKTFQTANWDIGLTYSPGKPQYNARTFGNNQLLRLKKVPELSINNRLGYLIEEGTYYNRTEISAKHRIWMSQFGYSDILIRGGMIWGRNIPYVKLFYPSANQSLLLSQNSFNMMKNMEFGMDKYVSWFWTHHFNGFVFNRIPYFNRLKWRGVVSFSGVYGGLSKSNMNNEVNPISHTLPYMELTAGIENIFRLFRIDYVRRLTYTNGLSGWQKNGIKVSVNIEM